MKSLNELGIEESIVKAIEELGFKEPMPVQEEVIAHLIESQVIYCTCTNGNWKTAIWNSTYSKIKRETNCSSASYIKSHARIMLTDCR